MKLFTFGYRGQSASRLKQVAEALNAKIIDVRLSPLYRVPQNQWSKRSLEQLFGERYEHIRAFGNKNYKTPELGMELLSQDAGVKRIAQLVVENEFGALILLCACAEYFQCHRQLVRSTVLTRLPEYETYGKTLEPETELVYAREWIATEPQPELL